MAILEKTNNLLLKRKVNKLIKLANYCIEHKVRLHQSLTHNDCLIESALPNSLNNHFAHYVYDNLTYNFQRTNKPPTDNEIVRAIFFYIDALNKSR